MKIRKEKLAGLTILPVATFALSLLAACSSTTENAIVGKWNGIGRTEKMELLKDGTLIDGSATGKYAFVDKDRIKVEMGNPRAPMVFVITVSVSGDELTWTMSDGTVYKYKKEK